MPKKRDPVIAVINYFESAELELVTQTLAIVQAIVKRRQPAARATRPAAKKAKETGAAAAPAAAAATVS